MAVRGITIDFTNPITHVAPDGIRLVFKPTRRLDSVGVVTPIRTYLNAGIGAVELLCTDDATYGEEPWAWEVTEYVPGRDGVTRWVLVPTGSGTLDYDALEEVGDPGAEAEPDQFWWQRMHALETALEEGDLQGDTGPQGDPGPQGNPGLSAYQVAQQNGFSGNEAQWLASLEGSDGAAGAAGATGPKGDKGDPGEDGLDGLGAPASFAPPSVSTTNVTGTSELFARADHSHSIAANAVGASQIQNGSVGWAKISIDDGQIPQVKVTNLTSDLAGKAATVHTHAQSDVTGLVSALAGKASTSHSHVVADVTGLQTALDDLAGAAGIKYWDGAVYGASEGAGIFVGSEDPGDVPDGSIWWILSLGPLGPGVRAYPGAVGYLGDEADLVELNPNDSFTGTTLDGNAAWDDGILRINASDFVMEGYLVNAAMYHGSGTNLTVRNCVFNCPAPGELGAGFFGISQSNDDRGTLIVEDVTMVCGSAGTDTYSAGIIADGWLEVRRCDVSGSGDGIHANAGGTSFSDCPIISQCYVHDLAFLDEDQHLDGIQIYNNMPDNTSTPSFMVIEHCRVDKVLSTSDTPMNSAATMGHAPGDLTGPLMAVKVDNNLFTSGTYHLRLGVQLHDCVVTNNNLGTLDTPGGEFGLASVEDGTMVDTWSNNRTGTGDAGTGTIVNLP